MEQDLNKILVERFNTDELISLIKSDDNLFKDLVKIAVSNHPKSSWRAAWIITKIIQNNDRNIKQSIPKILKVIEKRGDGHQRELIKIIDKMELSESQEGHLFDICLTIWEDISKTPSVRITAFKSVLKIAEKYPELKSELEYFTEDIFLENLSPGIKRSFKKL